ncbi:MAG: PP2C family protein-serine/threonine phosphatase [Candidatus Villigracilaceae bacterium]
MEIQVAVAKVSQYAAPQGSDLLEMIERPNGGLSVVLADGGSHKRSISMLVVRQVIALLAEGVRDGAAARAASDTLFTSHQGQVTCALTIASIDFLTNTLVLTRNNPTPVYISREAHVDCLSEECLPLGGSRNVRPVVSEIPLEPGLMVFIFSDGLFNAGKQLGRPMDACMLIQSLLEDQEPSPQEMADALLAHAILLDDHCPADDMSVVVIQVLARKGDDVRRLNVRLPFNLSGN